MLRLSNPALARDARDISVRRIVDALSVTLIAAVALIITAASLTDSYDDAYITYRYAYNFATGNGFVYNVGEWFMGTTAPFYGLLLGILGLTNPDLIPTISGAISGLSLMMAGLALWSYGRFHGYAFCGLVAGLFFVSNPLLPATFGGEMLFQVALILWAFVLYGHQHTTWAALLLALALLTRMDSLVAVGVIGGHALFVRRRLPWRELLLIVGVILPFALLTWLLYGSLLPRTLDAKQAQGASGLWPLFLEGSFEWLRAYTMQGSSLIFSNLVAAPSAIRYLYLIALGIPALLRFRFWLLPLSWIALYVAGYTVLAVPFYHWYVVPVVLGLMIMAASGVAGVAELILWATRRVVGAQPRWLAWALPIGALLLLAPGIAAHVLFSLRIAAVEPTVGKRLYIETGRWLHDNTPPSASVGFFEIGYLGYHAQRTMIDPVGLVNPGVAEAVADVDLTWAYRHYRPDYIVHNPYIFVGQIGTMLDEDWFQAEYREVATVALEPLHLVIYQRKPSS